MSNLKIGAHLHGFTVTNVRENAELGGTLTEMVFDKTGTQLCWVDNGERNKLFSVTFKTLPENSTGVFHILEHSVLCGSDKFPVREPFVELLKSSMNTFLNAMTFSDKTMYPVSSRNEQDFLNLTEVYLDAVFAPRILTDPNIFYQEGWHMEQHDKTLLYKGVVFNEMKGAMSGVDRIVEQEMLEQLFPDTCYGHNSGGDPTHIPDLSYEQFIATYKRFYHPSNARIFLDGAIPLEQTLALIESYLTRFTKSNALPVITMQTPKATTRTQYYELAKEEPKENKAQLTLGKIIGTWQERARILAAFVLKDVLAGSNEAPLKRAVLSAGLAQDVLFSIDDSIAQPYWQMQFKNVTDGKEEDLLATVRMTVKELLQKGLNKDALTASINRLAFRLKEPEEPQGLVRCINAMNSWLHDGDPMQYLLYDEDIAAVREMVENGGFTALLADLLENEDGLATLHTLPSYTRGEELRAEENARLAAVAATYTEEDWQQNALLNEKLTTWQKTPDSPAQLATLPVLSLQQVGEQPEFMPTQETEENGVRVLYHPAACHGIAHISLYFALTDYTLEELSLLSPVTGLLGVLATEQYSAIALQQQLKNTVGRFDVRLEAHSKLGQTDVCTPYLAVRFSTLTENLPQTQALVLEILQHTRLDETDRIREILVQMNERQKQVGITSGHALGMTSVLAQYSAEGAVLDAVRGYTCIRRLRKLVENNELATFTALLKRMLSMAICRANLTVSVAAAQPVAVTGLLTALPQGKKAPVTAAYRCSLPRRMGCTIPARIGFACQGYSLSECGIPFHAGMRVAAKLLSLSYLWNVVRVQGGAYGTSLRIDRNGNIFTYSYRDPTPGASLRANTAFSQVLRDFANSEEPLDKFIISTIASTEPLLSPREQGADADNKWFAGITLQTLTEDRREMLQTTKQTLLSTCPVWDAFAEKGAVTLIGFAEMLNDCPDLTVCEL